MTRRRTLVWVLWAGVALALAATAISTGDPALWFYVVDPELLTVMVLAGLQLLRTDVAVRVRVVTGAIRRHSRQEQDLPATSALSHASGPENV